MAFERSLAGCWRAVAGRLETHPTVRPMTTSLARLVRRLGLVAALALATVGAATQPTPASTQYVASDASTRRVELPAASLTPATPPRRVRPGAYTYRWPVKPFGQQHPVRGFFGDPRIANHGHTRQFHFGVDVSAPNGTPVYATLTGTAYIHSLHSTTVSITGEDGLEFSYWHVVPKVRSGQWVVAYETVIGHIEEPYGHVHFSEKRDGRYLNPLRSGAMGPFADHTTPEVRSVVLRAGVLVAEAYDRTPLAVPRPWHDLPVMPALVRWRVLDERGRVVQGWRTAADFRLTIPPADEFDERWAPGTTQNHVRAPGRYRVVLTRALGSLARGRLVVEIEASDTSENRSRARFGIGGPRP